MQNTGGKKNLGFQYFGCVIPRKPVKTVLKRLNRFSVNRLKTGRKKRLDRFFVFENNASHPVFGFSKMAPDAHLYLPVPLYDRWTIVVKYNRWTIVFNHRFFSIVERLFSTIPLYDRWTIGLSDPFSRSFNDRFQRSLFTIVERSFLTIPVYDRWTIVFTDSFLRSLSDRF